MRLILTACIGLSLTGCSGVSPIAPGVFPQADLEPIYSFLDADPWVHPTLKEPIGGWLRRTMIGARVYSDPTVPAMWGARTSISTREVFWPVRNEQTTMIYQAAMLIHEARHIQGIDHTCGTKDRSMEEGGAYAVQILYLRHMGMGAMADDVQRQGVGC